MNPVEHEPATSAECFIKALKAEFHAERERARKKLITEGMPIREIEAILRYAEGMHDAQIASAERRLGLAPAVALH